LAAEATVFKGSPRWRPFGADRHGGRQVAIVQPAHHFSRRLEVAAVQEGIEGLSPESAAPPGW